MNNWPRKPFFTLIFSLMAFSVVSVSGLAQSGDSDTAEIGLVVTNGCPEVVEDASADGDGTGSTNSGCEPIDPDTDGKVPPPVVLEPPSEDCPGQSGSVTSSLVAYGVSGQTSDIGTVLFAQAGDVEGPCPDDPVDPETVASVGGGSSTVPVVNKLPDTGISPENFAGAHWMDAAIAAGFLLAIAGLVSSRSGAKHRVE